MRVRSLASMLTFAALTVVAGVYAPRAARRLLHVLQQFLDGDAAARLFDTGRQAIAEAAIGQQHGNRHHAEGQCAAKIRLCQQQAKQDEPAQGPGPGKLHRRILSVVAGGSG